MNVLAVFVLFLIFFMCTPDNHPSSLIRFTRSKTVKVKKFPLFKKLNKTPLFWRGHTVTTATPFWPPATHRVSPFQNIPLFFYLCYALPPVIQFHLLYTFSFNTCAMVIIWLVFGMYQGTGYPNNLPQYFSTIVQNYTATYQAARSNNPPTLYLGDLVQTIQTTAKLFSVCPYRWLNIILPHTRCWCVWPISGLPIQVHGVTKPQICSPKSVHSHLLILTNADQLKLVQDSKLNKPQPLQWHN